MNTILTTAAAVSIALAASGALAQSPKYSDGVIRIGVLNDRAGPISDMSGEGSVIAARMAVEEFKNSIHGIPIEIVFADHQNKTDIGAAIARKWYDVDGVDIIVDVSNSSISLALAPIVRERKKLVIQNSASSEITGKSCAARSLQWLYNADSTASNVVTKKDVADGVDTFFVIAVDNALGVSLTKAFKASLASKGGKILGELRHPLNTTDFSSYLLQAQSSGAKGVLLANAGSDLGNSTKQAHEFGLVPKQILMTAIVTTSEIESNGLAAMEGLRAVSSYEWNLNDTTRTWAKSYATRSGGRLPAGPQVGVYSQTRHYLKAVEAAGTDDADLVLAKMRELPVNDAFATNGLVREDGQMVHDMFLVRVKKPSESTGKGDYSEVLQIIPGPEAFQTLAQSECPLLKK